MEIAGAVASMVQCLCGECCSNESISQQCGYLRKPQSVVRELEDKIKLLTAREADLRAKLLEEKRRHGKDPTAEVNLWLDNVEKMKAVLACLEKDIEEKESWICGCFPNCYHRLKFGNYVTRKMQKVDKLLVQSNFSESSLVNMMPERGKRFATSLLVGETAERILWRTWEYLLDNNTGIVGVYGMGGVGKTTIIKEINNKLLQENTYFDDVLWVTASKDINVQKLQKEIAKEIELSFNDEDGETRRASRLFEALLRKGRFCLIIDDLWESFSLENIGIPIPTVANGCKLLITTRSLSVCRRMETAIDIEVDLLSQEEAWYLFKQKVGEDVLSSPIMQDLARSVAKECGGLPLALITVGRALRKDNNIRYWQTALSELRNSTERIEGMQDQVFARLRFSYDRLKDDMTRECFLYCALYPEDHLIGTEELIKYWVWEGLLGSSGSHTVKMQFGEMILNELKRACMLESVYQEGSPNEFVKMHDLIRDMVIALTRANSTFMVKSGHGLRLPPLENEWSPDLVRVSLMRNDLSVLNLEPKCPKLCTLLLQYNSISKGFCDAFFQHMQSLKILDLSYTGISDLPLSLSDLESLHTLLLRSCWNLYSIPTLEKLKELRVLDLSYSSIQKMPEGLEMLINLHHLDMSFTNGFGIPFHILPSYRFLESLFLITHRQYDDGPVLADTLAKCSSLVELEMIFESVQDFDIYMASDHWSLLENFRFCIGNLPYSINTGKNSVAFFEADFDGGLGPDWFPDGVLELEMSNCHGITCIPLSIAAAASQLQRCRINYCDEMEFIIMANWRTFPNLECLEMEGLSNLSRLCNGMPAAGTLASLKVLHVTSCNHLKTLLPLNLVPHLRNLVELRIEDCERIEEVISVGYEDGEITEENHHDVFLPSLQILKLSSLPKLEQISRGVMVCDSLSSLEVLQCPDLTTLPFLEDIRVELVNSLKQIKGSRRWWKTIRRNHRNAVNLLCPVFKEVPEQSAVEVYSEDGSIRSDGSGSSSFGPSSHNYAEFEGEGSGGNEYNDYGHEGWWHDKDGRFLQIERTVIKKIEATADGLCRQSSSN